MPKEGVGAASRQVLVDSRQSLYSLWGDWLAQLASLAAIGLLAMVWLRGRPARKQRIQAR